MAIHRGRSTILTVQLKSSRPMKPCGSCVHWVEKSGVNMSREPLLSQRQHLNPQLFHKGVSQVPIRQGFGEGLRLAGEQNSQVVAMSADLTESTRMNFFAEAYP